MKCKFVVGQKVVCISDKWVSDKPNDPRMKGSLPQNGEIVTIKGLIPDDDPIYEVLLILREYDENIRFAHHDFRPLKERPTETSIEVFRKHLTPTDKFVKEKV